MGKLDIRSRRDEQMDAVDLDPGVYARVLHDLARVNRFTFTAWPAIAFLKRAVVDKGSFRLLDVGFGDGDILRVIARWALRSGIAAELVGVDLNAKSVKVARDATPQSIAIDYRAGDYAEQAGPWDFVISSQVTHHMSDTQLLAFLRWMEAEARRGWLICDLHRLAFAHWGFPILGHLLRVHRIVREDGQLSIARSFRKSEWQDYLRQAGIPLGEVRVVRRFAARLCVERVRPG
jgi:2-polyprenyl-3-methyl-5-hydroxy-6-metoxy-1,4-benzoquinol methylase